MKITKFITVISYSLLVFCSFTIQAHQDPKLNSYKILTDKINQSERDSRLYEVIQLPNQMKVLLISDPQAVKSLASLALPVGSLHDPKLQQGLAHYTEHMVLMGSERYPEPASFSQFLTQHAGRYNASTAAYRTAYYFEVENSALTPALDRLADAIAAPKLDPSYADKERNAVDAELTMARSNDGFRIGQVDSETINQAHPSSLFSGGNLQTLSDKPDSILQHELEAFYQRYYSANLMVAVIYSNKPLSELADIAEETLGRIKNRDSQVEPITQQAITTNEVGKMIYMEPAQAKKLLYMQFPIENNIAQFADKTDEYIGYMLSHRSENTLFDRLQKQGLIESISSRADPIRYGNSGNFGIYATLTDQGLANKDQVIAAIFSYLEMLRHNGVSKPYYDEIKHVLALEFNYPDIDHDMSYVEWLSDQMLFYPLSHVLDADYVADHFNQPAIDARLASLTVDNARIWVIAPDQSTDKTAYFVDAPYRIEDISQQQKQLWHNSEQQVEFSLPQLNSYIPTDFTIVTQNDVNSGIEQKFSPQGNRFHFASRYFADEPKAAIVLSLRNSELFNSVEEQVEFQLFDYIVNRALAQQRFQASVAGINFSTQLDDGIMIYASGFNQHLIDIVNDIVKTYHNVEVDQSVLSLAKSWYLEKLDVADHVNSYSLAMQPFNALSSIPYFERQDKREVVATISVEDIKQYRYRLLNDVVPYMLSVGNLSDQQLEQLYAIVKLDLADNVDYTPKTAVTVKDSHGVKLVQQAASTDNALYMTFIPPYVDKISGRTTSYLLYKIISPWFYDQLRSNEQLGYAVFSLPAYLGDSSGIGFLIQSNQYDPAYLNLRYQAFYPIILQKLTELSDSEFEQYKTSVISELLMAPQTLDDEIGQYLPDYRQSLFDFDSRNRQIAYLKTLHKDNVIDFFQQAVMEKKGLVLASEVVGAPSNKESGGTNMSDNPVNDNALNDNHSNGLDELTLYPNASTLQQILVSEP